MQLQTNADLHTEKLYDLCMIEQLCRGNQEKIKKMVEVFIVQAPKSVEEIKIAFLQGDFAVIKTVAHRIKPTLSYYAIIKIEKDIQQIEKLAKEGSNSDELKLKIMKVDDVITRVVEKMKQDILQN